MNCDHFCHPSAGPIPTLNCRYVDCKLIPDSACCSHNFTKSTFVQSYDQCRQCPLTGSWKSTMPAHQSCYWNDMQAAARGSGATGRQKIFPDNFFKTH